MRFVMRTELPVPGANMSKHILPTSCADDSVLFAPNCMIASTTVGLLFALRSMMRVEW